MLVQNQGAGLATQDVHRSAAADLWSRYFQSRSVDDRNRLVLFYAPLVKLVASRFASRLRSFQSVRELCSCSDFNCCAATLE